MSQLQLIAPWKWNMGIELTFVPKKFNARMEKDNLHKGWEVAAGKMRSAMVVAGFYSGRFSEESPSTTKDLVMEVARDPGCVETPTRVLTSWKDAKDVWQKIMKVADSVDLAPRDTGGDAETGMGHIHASMNVRQAKAVMMETLHRPYLSWIFATPNGSEYCGNLSLGHIRLQKNDPNGPFLNDSKSCIMTWRSECGSWDSNHGNPHLEWRAFDAAETWRMQEEHIAFLQAYYSWINKNPRAWPTGLDCMDDDYAAAVRHIYAHDMELCIREFKDLIINKLKLPWNRYSWYLNFNLKPAFEWGDRN
jgi:hypothetical protein